MGVRLLSPFFYNTDCLLSQSLDKSVAYNSNRQVTEEWLANGSYIKYNYNDKKVTQTSSVGSKEETTVTEYDDSLNVVQSTDNEGNVTRYAYDDENRLVTVSCVETDEDGEETETVTSSYEYDGDQLVSSTEDDATEAYTYDSDGNLLTAVSDDAKTEYTYDNGNVITAKSYEVKTAESEETESTEETEEDEEEETPPEYELVSESLYTYEGSVLTKSVTTDYAENTTTVTTTDYTNGKADHEKIVETAAETNSETNETETTVTETTTAYTYDIFGNVTASSSISKTNDEDEESLSSMSYAYDELGRCTKSEDLCNNAVISYCYDSTGNTVLEKETGTESTEYARNVYDCYGRLIQEISNENYNAEKDGISFDEQGNVSAMNDTYSDADAGCSYAYNAETFNLDSETNELGVKTTYTYNKGVTKTEDFDIYSYIYNDYGNVVDIWVSKSKSERPYAHYEYDDNQLVTSIAYGNEQTVYYEYDNDGNLKYQKYQDKKDTDKTLQFEYVYTDGELTYKIDYVNSCTEWYEDGITSVYTLAYDENNEVVKGTFLSSYEDASDENDESTSIHTDKNNSSSLKSVYTENKDSFETVSGTYNFAYDSSEDESTSTTAVTKDGESESVVKYDYTYDDDGNVTGYTVTTPSYSKQYVYTYDADGRITSYGSVKDGALNPNDCSYYHYDKKGQLVRADENVNGSPLNGTEVCEYDNRGNLTGIHTYNYTASDLPENPNGTIELEYSYEDNVWIDAIETTGTYDHQFLYDENGNTIRFEDANFNWTNGRMLSSIIFDESEEPLVSYTYDEDGIRTSRTFGETTTYFTTVDGTITSQYELDENKNVVNLIEFLYDSNNDIQGFTYDGSTYFYIKNVQGDVTNIVDSEGNVLADYSYDTWGLTSVDRDNSSNEIATINPIRYRGYYQDEGIGAYYLQSRYYIAEWSRFLNSDLPSIAKESKNELNGLNLFAYCCNDPVNNADYSGMSSNPTAHDLLKAFLTKYLIKGKKITKYSKMVKDCNGLYERNVYYKKSKRNTNKFSVTFAYKGAWEKSKNWLNSIEPKSGLINNYFSQIQSIMTRTGTITPEQAEKNKAQLISSNVCMICIVLGAGVKALKINSIYKKVWGNKGLDPSNKQKYVLFHISKEKGLNGWYVFKYSNSKVIKL
ncbi:MAG: RHS repeat domain-containing protein [Eubacterium sp.]